MPYTDEIDRINKETYGMASAVHDYAVKGDETTPAERAVLDRVAADVSGQPILEIGMGTGRSVRAIRALSADYRAIDYTPRMVDHARRRFPDVDFSVGDARQMERFSDGSFALVVFFCQGIDMVRHADRYVILREVFRVLRPGGYYVFSTHNQDSADHDAGLVLPSFQPTLNPARFAVRALRFARQTALRVMNRRRFDKLSVRTPEYSLINDVAHEYRMMAYYVSLPVQKKQLAEVGFSDVEAYDMRGRRVDATTDCHVHFVARR